MIRFKVCYNLEIQVIFHKYSSKYLISLVNLCNVNVERSFLNNYFLANYRVQAKSLDIGNWTFFLEFKSRRRPRTLGGTSNRNQYNQQIICTLPAHTCTLPALSRMLLHSPAHSRTLPHTPTLSCILPHILFLLLSKSETNLAILKCTVYCIEYSLSSLIKKWDQSCYLEMHLIL